MKPRFASRCSRGGEIWWHLLNFGCDLSHEDHRKFYTQSAISPLSRLGQVVWAMNIGKEPSRAKCLEDGTNPQKNVGQVMLGSLFAAWERLFSTVSSSVNWMDPAAGIACHQNPTIRGMLQRLTGRDFDMQLRKLVSGHCPIHICLVWRTLQINGWETFTGTNEWYMIWTLDPRCNTDQDCHTTCWDSNYHRNPCFDFRCKEAFSSSWGCPISGTQLQHWIAMGRSYFNLFHTISIALILLPFDFKRENAGAKFPQWGRIRVSAWDLETVVVLSAESSPLQL